MPHLTMRLPLTLLALLTTATETLAIDPIYLTNYTTYPNISLALTPSNFLSLSTSHYNGSLSLPGTALSSPGLSTHFPLSILVRDLPNSRKPHFSTTQTLVYLDANSTEGLLTGLGNQTLVDGSGWRNCLLLFKNVTSTATREGQGDDGSCGGTLGEECVRDLEGVVGMKNGVGNGTGTCADLELRGGLPGSCVGKIDLNGTEPWVVANVTYNSEGYYPLLEVQSPLHVWSDDTVLATARQRIWPIVSWQSQGSTSSTGMGCLRASSRSNGTESAASTVSGGGGGHWVVVFGLAVWTAWHLS